MIFYYNDIHYRYKEYRYAIVLQAVLVIIIRYTSKISDFWRIIRLRSDGINRALKEPAFRLDRHSGQTARRGCQQCHGLLRSK